MVLAFYAAHRSHPWSSRRGSRGCGFSEAVGFARPCPSGRRWGSRSSRVFVARGWSPCCGRSRLRRCTCSLPGGSVDITRIFGGSPAGIVVTVLVAVVVGPFVEELVFRGVAFAQLARVQGTAAGVVGSSVLFGLLHVNPLELVPLMLAGALFAWVFRRRARCGPPWPRMPHSTSSPSIALYAIKAAAR